jgi:hypothetical protein
VLYTRECSIPWASPNYLAYTICCCPEGYDPQIRGDLGDWTFPYTPQGKVQTLLGFEASVTRQQCFFFQFPDGASWRASLGRFRLNWGYYFKELLNLWPVAINVATPSSEKTILGELFFKTKDFAT